MFLFIYHCAVELITEKNKSLCPILSLILESNPNYRALTRHHLNMEFDDILVPITLCFKILAGLFLALWTQ